MLALVFKRANQLKVFDLIVELNFVFVVDLVLRWDWAEVSLPNNVMFHSVTELLIVPDTPITLGGELAVSTRS